ncbi:MAG TPA: patatin-like phospholipase family protein [Allosphingosinicella sp.]|jgi:hypothetical protein|uniref:patatin-like phospholipase family protein n=1 Tax=Allosphingosinicella sp. TaxID=2823234 RepID=UPI002F270F0E
MCHLPSLPLRVERPDGTRALSFSDTLRSRLTPGRSRGEQAAKPEDMLVLSGGGKWGSYGAGFLQAWKGVPRFKTVTGVSTGALQGTFALLGRTLPPDDRILQPGDDFPALPADRSNLDDLVAGYTISREKTLLASHGGELGVLRKGSFGDLAPLRTRIERLITPGTLRDVAAAGDEDRRFYVGLLNADTGFAEAVDMTALASRARTGDAEAVRSCYIDTLLAASSEPVGALPVFIDDQMYLDAGVRFGVFLEEVAAAVRPPGAGAAVTPPAERPNVYMIVNGDMSIAAEESPRPRWSALTVAKRSMTLVTDQIYLFSTDRVADWSRDRANFYFSYARGWGDHRWQGQSCRDWQKLDKAEAKPLQFYPRMMKCLIDFGRERRRTRPWDARPALTTSLNSG